MARTPTLVEPLQSRPPLLVRGTLIERPFRIRILIREITEPKVEILGSDLRDEKGRLVDARRLRCQREGGTTSVSGATPGEPFPRLLAAPETVRWNCMAPNYRRRLEDLLRLTPHVGFVSVNKVFFRGAIDLVPRGDRLLLINELDMDSYLAGLLNKEMRSDFPDEALKAQAVAARSYALATAADRRKNGAVFDLVGTEADQVYEGTESENARTFRMVRATKDLVLFHQEEVLRAWYHASSGGHSEHPSNVWGSSRDNLAYLARESPFDNAAETTWTVVLSPLMGLRWPEIGKLLDFRVLERSPGQRVQKVLVTGIQASRVWTGAELRRRLGPRWLKSTLFQVKSAGAGWRLEGQGWGHGVGLSQLGARAMARQGKSFEKILEHYYPNASLRRFPLDAETPPVAAFAR